MRNPLPVLMRVLPVLGLLALCAAPAAAQVSAKKTNASYFLYRQNLGPYSRVDRSLQEVEKYVAEHGLSGPLIGIYYDNPARTAPSLQRSDLGVRVSEEKALEILKKARPDDDEATLREELETERGARIEDPYYVRYLESRLVAARTVTAPFDEMFRYYSSIQSWIWKNGYFLVGPVTEIYMSPIDGDNPVRAEIQIVIKRTGVPDRR